MAEPSSVITLSDAPPERIRNLLIENLACPVDWQTGGVFGGADLIFLQKWHNVVADNLPNGELDAHLLRGEAWDCSFLPRPDETSFEWAHLSDQDALALAVNSEANKERYRAEYLDECLRFHRLRAQSAKERSKHYVLGAKTVAEVQAHSARYPAIGYLLPNLNPDLQLYAFWAAVSGYFSCRTVREEEVHGDLSEREIFETVWNELFKVHQFRFSINMLTTVGYSSGQPANWLIFDTSIDGKITHCYPALAPLDDSLNSSLDDLQGLEDCFARGEEFPMQYLRTDLNVSDDLSREAPR